MAFTIPKSMLFVDITEAGDPEVLQIRERPVPDMSNDEVLIKVAGAGLNGADMTQRRGKYPMPPGASASITDCAVRPIQSAANTTSRPPSAAFRGSSSGFSDISGTILPLGRSKWDIKTTRHPLSANSRIVGASRSMRMASLILPSCMGTLRSPRSRTRVPAGAFSSAGRVSSV